MAESGSVAAEEEASLKDMWEARTQMAFCFLGLLNNFTFVVIISAAHDILGEIDVKNNVVRPFERECNSLSTGIILLLEMAPVCVTMFLLPTEQRTILLRAALVVLTSALGLILVAARSASWAVFLGVVCVSFSCGLGKSTFIAYMPFFDAVNLFPLWSFGSLFTGILSTGSYVGLTLGGISAEDTIWTMLAVPTVQALCFIFFIKHPEINVRFKHPDSAPETVLPSWKENFYFFSFVLPKFMLPLALTHLFELLINQALFELLYFPGIYLDHHSQYRVYQAVFHLGLFLSRISVSLMELDWLWFLTLLQFLNLVLFTTEVLKGIMMRLEFCLLVILWEGLIGGWSYANTYRLIASNVEQEKKKQCIAFCNAVENIVIIVAGALTNPIHKVFCNSIKPYPY